MYRTLLGEAGFKRGMKLYFERHDGSAVTCNDFLNAMAGSLCFMFLSSVMRGNNHLYVFISVELELLYF